MQSGLVLQVCAYLKGQDLLKKYAGAWKADEWYEMVLSLKVGVCPADPTHDTMRDVLDAMEALVKRLQSNKLMDGYVAWLEVKMHQFYPHLIVTPHIHVLLRCERPPAPIHEPLAAQGGNFAVLSGFCLQSLLESLTCPLASLGFHFHLNLSQGLGALRFSLHPLPFVRGSWPFTLSNRYSPIMGGSVKMRPPSTPAGSGCLTRPLSLLSSRALVGGVFPPPGCF